MADIDQKTLAEYCMYSNGNLYWIKVSGCKVKVGDTVGWSAKRDGRRGFSLLKKKMLVHRAIWVLKNGPIPSGMLIDHINRDPSDNRIENLRLATPHQSSGNTGRHKTKSSSQFKGVFKYKRPGYERWITMLGGIKYHATEIEAAIAYNFLAKDAFGEFAVLNEVRIG